jgi:tRNA(Ile)-lysidine synthase
MLLAEVQACVETYALLSPGDTVIVAVSGGADSMALLYVLLQLRSQYALTVVVAHVNHQLRGIESERDALFVEQQARRCGVPSYQTRVDVKALQRQARLALHPAARQLRYHFLQTLARKLDATRVATGHTADDQAETLMMRLVRGSSATGLAGIPAVRGPFIRPLLTVSRHTIQTYLQQADIAWIEDRSNEQMLYVRNRVRHDLLPKLRQYNPQVLGRLNSLADLLRAENDLLEAQVDAWAPSLVDGSMTYKRTMLCTQFRQAPLAIQRRLLYRVTASLAGTADAFGWRHIESLRQWMSTTAWAQRWHGPAHIIAVRQGEVAVLWNLQRLPTFPAELLLPVPGRVDLTALNIRLRAEMLEPPAHAATSSRHEVLLDLERVVCPLQVRFWRSGDRFRPLGACGRKKLHDFFIDSKIPRFERPYIPLVVSSQTIVWVVGYRMAEECKLGAQTRRVVRLQASVFPPVDVHTGETPGLSRYYASAGSYSSIGSYKYISRG